ncbi:MAG: hypothetical protein ACK4NR_11455 [Micavibrio sp.]
MKPDPQSQEGRIASTAPAQDMPRDELLRMVTRRQKAEGAPQQVGASFFFEVKPGWEVRALADDLNVRKIFTLSGLEDAFHDKTVRTILITRESSVSRNVAIRVCRRHGQGKTVFFEIDPQDYSA